MSAIAVVFPGAVRDDRGSSHGPQLMSDERLVEAAKAGHTAAFDELYTRHREKMFRVTYRITRNREDAEDAVQDCFLNAFLHVRSFHHKARFSTWLTRIAINAALMKVRKNLASREVQMEEHLHATELLSEHQLPDSSLTPEECCAKNEQEAIVRNAVSKLRPRIGKVVEFRLQEHSLGETAEILGISVGTAKTRLFHARTALRQHLRSRISLKI